MKKPTVLERKNATTAYEKTIRMMSRIAPLKDHQMDVFNDNVKGISVNTKA